MFGWRKRDSGAVIAEFWQWYGSVGSLAGEISRRVAAIDKNLHWELNKGSNAKHSLVVAPAGNAALRATVARWLAAAPAGDPVFEYFGSRQPDDEVLTAQIEIAGRSLELGQLRFAFTVQEDAHDVDVAVFHPDFSTLPESVALQVTFLALDWAMGEDQVELWVGRVDTLSMAPPDLGTAEDLRAAVAALAAKHAQPVYAMLSAQTDKGLPVLAMVQVPLKAARWPRFDTHVAVTLRFAAQENGLPTDESLAQLRDVEDRIADALCADGEVVAHQTSAGTRTLHVYVDGWTTAADTVIKVVTVGPLRTTIKATYDPGLDRVGHLRT